MQNWDSGNLTTGLELWYIYVRCAAFNNTSFLPCCQVKPESGMPPYHRKSVEQIMQNPTSYPIKVAPSALMTFPCEAVRGAYRG
jgi:hypothetical protein